MITAEVFRSKWDTKKSELIKFDKQIVQGTGLCQTTKDFLLQSGLPDSAPPFLTFQPSKANNLPLKYFEIGFTGDGSSICINKKYESIMYLDHDNDDNEVFINTSLAQLMESLLVYVDFISELNKTNGRGAFLKRIASSTVVLQLKNTLLSVDHSICKENDFWSQELGNYSSHSI